MSATPQTGEMQAIAAPGRSALPSRGWAGALAARVRPHHALLAGVLALSAVLTTNRLSQNSWANTFYSAGVKSMLRSWHNFLFVSFDPGGLVTIDKPPLALWLQAASAKLFGFTPLALLLPEAVLAPVAVAVLYRVLARRLGAGAALAGALALAVFPSFVAVSRDNGVDTLLILLMLLACGAALNAIELGRWRWVLASAVLVGLAFNTKTLAAYLVLPGILAGYLLCAPRSLPVRLVQLAAFGAVTFAVSFSWIALVELTPAGSRPFVGGSTDNTELGLTFDYNGFGRVNGETGGPGQIPLAAGAVVPVAPRHLHSGRVVVHHIHWRMTPVLPNGRKRDVIPFGGRVGPLRLLHSSLATQAAWTLPLALIGMLALGLALLRRGMTRRDPRLAAGVVLGGWFAVEAVLLSFSKGIVHPYYLSALAPGAAAMAGAGAGVFAQSARGRDWRVALLPCAVIATAALELVLLHKQHYMNWFAPVLVGVSLGSLALAAWRRLSAVGVALAVGALMVAPAAIAASTWTAPVEGTFPAAGPHEAAGVGPYGLDEKGVRQFRHLYEYVSTHHPAKRFALLTDASVTAAPFILMGMDAAAVGGYSGTDPSIDGPLLARWVVRHEARYVLLGGAYASRGGNLGTKAVLRDCREVPHAAWHGPVPAHYSLALFDCAGRQRALAREPRYHMGLPS